MKATQLIILSFLLIIVSGTLLLLLPVSTVQHSLSFVDALFTAVSATCVTGLSVIDIGTRLTLFGQVVVLALIQVGGLGIMTFSTFFIYLVSRKFGIRERELIQQTLSQHPMKDIGELLKSVFIVTILIEVCGAGLYFLKFSTQFPYHKALFYSIFHSISAFCNAGFSLFPNSLMQYKGNLLINLTTVILIILGGFGFIVIHDIFSHLWRRKSIKKTQFNYYTKVVLVTSFWLIIGGTIIFFIFDFFNQLRMLSWPNKLLVSFFQSVTSRTAGFNTVEIGAVSNASLMLIMALMFIGASPASCGGGIKTSTFAVILAMIGARFRNRQDINLFQRRISQDVVSKAISITVFSFLIIALFTIILLFVEIGGVSHFQTRGSFLEILFETISAYATVGLSTGITSDFSSLGRILLAVLMFVGRLGPLTLALAIIEGKQSKPLYRFAEENILVG